MSRSGTISLLGAGADVEAGYPTASQFLRRFRELLHSHAEQEKEAAARFKVELEKAKLAHAGQPNTILITPPPRDVPTLEEWFEPIWQRFATANAAIRPLAVPSLNKDGRPELHGAVSFSHGGAPSFAPYTLPLEGKVDASPPTPYLEDFFSFYDDLLRPRVRRLSEGISFQKTAPLGSGPYAK